MNSDEPEVKDVANDGKIELVLPTDFTSYYGANHCVADWPVVYAWTGSTYSDVSSQYKRYYERQLELLQKQIQAAEAAEEKAQRSSANPKPGASAEEPAEKTFQGPSVAVERPPGVSVEMLAPVMPAPPQAPREPDRLDLDCQKAEAAKIERFLGSRDAGMADAIKWSESDNSYDREFAADVLADIGTPEAVEYLRTLSRDSEKMVAGIARSGLVKVRKGPASHTIDLEGVADAAGNPIPQ